MRRLPTLLTLVQKYGLSKLAQEAAEIGRVSSEQQRNMLQDFLTATDGDDPGSNSFFARALFQSHAEYLAAAQPAQLAGFSGSDCPVCNAKPQVAILRPEGEGGSASSSAPSA